MSPMQTLRATAKSFIPGSLSHVIKRVTWNTLGITNVRMFDINEDEVIARGRTSDLSHGLHETSNYHKSKIKMNNESEAVPFKIPKNDTSKDNTSKDNISKDNTSKDNTSKDNTPIIPILPPAYTATLYRTNTIKGVEQDTEPINININYNRYNYNRYNYCDN